MVRTAIFLALAAGAASAEELSEGQQAAYDAVLPSLETALEEQGGDAAKDMAPMLATCMVTEARRRELRDLSGEIGETEIALVNDIMMRPKVQGCVAKAVGQG